METITNRMNFCAPCMNPEISSSKPGADGRDVTNLVSDDPTVRRKGFMAEYFIRPPIDVSLVFTAPVHISHIIINSRVNHMISSGFFVFTKLDDTSPLQYAAPNNNKSKNSTESSDTTSFNVHVGDKGNVTSSLSTSSGFTYVFENNVSENLDANKLTQQIDYTTGSEQKFEDIFFCVGKFFTKHEESIILKNPFYQHWLNIPMPVHRESSSAEYKGTLRHPNREALKSVKSLIIRIMNTADRGPPAIQSLEVWGQPSITTSKSQKRILINKWKSQKQEAQAVLLVPRLYNSEPEENPQKTQVASCSTSISKDSLDIPDDFLDPLTCEVMCVPLMMPSGHSIDAQTLEKFVANEAIWGRPPSDPFTGVPFKQGSYPTPNVPLKARIDRFLILHADHNDIKKVGRTVGSASHTYGHWREDHNEDNSASLSLKRKSESKGEGLCKKTEKNTISNDTGARRNILSGVRELPRTVHQSQVKCNAPAANIDIKKKRSIEGSFTSERSGSRTGSHRKLLPTPVHSSNPHSLVHMIGGVISIATNRVPQVKGILCHKVDERPSTIKCGDTKPEEFNLQSSILKACICGKKDDLYKLPCQHIFCRHCLQLSINENKCLECKNPFNKSDVIKHHLESIYSVPGNKQ